MNNTEAILKIENLETYYDQRKILDGINLEIFSGETMTILGRSGCGKSTLLRHMIGLTKPNSGKIYIKGQDIISLSEDEMLPIRRKIGMLFQGSALFNSMSLGDNVALTLREHTSLEESTIKIRRIRPDRRCGNRSAYFEIKESVQYDHRRGNPRAGIGCNDCR